jgi:uncharacterized membrane protein YidH (DUF202 family)
MSAARFPRWVYGEGSEPDPRATLANERTFLAWIRTALALTASGIALEALAVPMLPAFAGCRCSAAHARAGRASGGLGGLGGHRTGVAQT